MPTLVIHGDSRRDRAVRGQRQALRTRRSPAAELRVIEGGPHGLNATHADEFNAALLEFLAR